MKIYCWESPEGNIGDDLNKWIWPKLFDEEFFACYPQSIFIGIGSVLDDRHEHETHRIVFGAGRRGTKLPDIASPGWEVIFVRGPHTAEAFGGSGPEYISDPAIVAPLADHRFRAREKRQLPKSQDLRIGFIPYWGTRRTFAETLANAAGLRLIPPTLGPSRFFSALLDCDVILAEAMHGAILADAFGIPWAPCRLRSQKAEGPTHALKWSDWAETLSLDLEFIDLPYIHRPAGRRLHQDMAIQATIYLAGRRVRNIISDGNWYLSNRQRLEYLQQRILRRVAELRSSKKFFLTSLGTGAAVGVASRRVV